MHIKINENGSTCYPYSFAQLKADNRGVSYPAAPTEAALASYGLHPVTETQPQYDQATHRVEEAQPVLVDNVWTQAWDVIPLTEEELAQREAKRIRQVEGERAYAYRNESDPLFFKWQRGEATQQEWIDKVAEIKARYPS